MSNDNGITNNCNVATPDQIVLAAAAVSIALTSGRTIDEIETLLNLLTLIRENTQRILAQRLVCQRDTSVIDVEI